MSKQDQDTVQKDKADRIADEYEGAKHDRAGHNKQGTSGSTKPHSVRNN
jgi:hypothetical protein